MVTRQLDSDSAGRGVALVWRKTDPRHIHYSEFAHMLREERILPMVVLKKFGVAEALLSDYEFVHMRILPIHDRLNDVMQ